MEKDKNIYSAIREVFKELNSMSYEELNEEMDRYSNDERRKSISYAFSIRNYLIAMSNIPSFTWEIPSVSYSIAIRDCSEKCSTSSIENREYFQLKASDDYYYEIAA